MGMGQDILSFDFDHLDLRRVCLMVKSDLYARKYWSYGTFPIRCPIIKMLNSIGGRLSDEVLDTISARVGSSYDRSELLSSIRCGPAWWMRNFDNEEENDFSVDIEYVFRNVLRQDMFPYDLKLGMARWLLEKCRKVGWLCRANDKQFGYRYTLNDLPVYNEIGLFTNVDYEHWRQGGKEEVRRSIETAYQGELAFVDFTQYDISEFDFLIGDCASTAKQLMTASCTSQLQIERESAIADLQQFCDAIDNAATMGWSRENVYRYDITIGNSNVWAKVWDDGKFTRFIKRHFR